MISVCLPSDAVSQHLPSYLGFFYLGRGVSLQGCSSKVQPLLLTLDQGYLLTTAPSDLECGIAPLGPPAPTQSLLLGGGVAPPGCHPRPQAWGWSSQPPPLASGVGLLLPAATPSLRRGVGPPARRPWPRAWGSSPGRCPGPRMWGGSSRLLLRCHSPALSAAIPDLGHGVAPLGCRP